MVGHAQKFVSKMFAKLRRLTSYPKVDEPGAAFMLSLHTGQPDIIRHRLVGLPYEA